MIKLTANNKANIYPIYYSSQFVIKQQNTIHVTLHDGGPPAASSSQLDILCSTWCCSPCDLSLWVPLV